MSTQKQYIVEEPFQLTATPISWLEPMSKDELSAIDDIYVVVSKPDFQVQDTHYMSKKLSLGELSGALADSLGADEINGKIDDMQSEIDQLTSIANLTCLLKGEAKLSAADGRQMLITDPYVISSVQFGDGNLSSLSGYSLCEALSAIFPRSLYSEVKASSISCSTLKVGGSEIQSIEEATSEKAGIVKAYASNESASGIEYIVQDGNSGLLKVQLAAIVDAVKRDIYDQLLADIKSWIAANYIQTKVVPSMPPVWNNNTLYCIADGPIDAYEVTIEYDQDKTVAEAYVGDVKISNGAKVKNTQHVVAVSMPKDGYEYSSVQDGWQKNSATGSIQKQFVVDDKQLHIIVPDPTEVQTPAQEED